jgi:Na+/proline symporter
MFITGKPTYKLLRFKIQTTFKRFKAARTHRQARIALLLNIPIVIIFMSLCSLIGLVVYANYHDCDPLEMGYIKTPNQYSSHFVLNNMNMIPGAIGFFLGALFCSSLSSLASCLNSLALIIWVFISKLLLF